ncbi:hypothetical protein H5410_003341 [Solanum commersonii]|uniref:Uncharacterized protein n=1 Tax=Solanum commersonii TaxID=4109 RepID=A0A9J6B4R5_SOLCO|nr:hypothetical protein H5410_003341 [Solanum commersonii]
MYSVLLSWKYTSEVTKDKIVLVYILMKGMPVNVGSLLRQNIMKFRNNKRKGSQVGRHQPSTEPWIPSWAMKGTMVRGGACGKVDSVLPKARLLSRAARRLVKSQTGRDGGHKGR